MRNNLNTKKIIDQINVALLQHNMTLQRQVEQLSVEVMKRNFLMTAMVHQNNGQVVLTPAVFQEAEKYMLEQQQGVVDTNSVVFKTVLKPPSEEKPN